MAADLWQLANGWELVDWSLLVDATSPDDVVPEIGGALPRRGRTAVYASARWSLPRATSRPAVGVVLVPLVPLVPERVAAVVVASAFPLRLSSRAPAAIGRRTTFATASGHVALRRVVSSAAGSVWTQQDEEFELFLLGLFS